MSCLSVFIRIRVYLGAMSPFYRPGTLNAIFCQT